MASGCYAGERADIDCDWLSTAAHTICGRDGVAWLWCNCSSRQIRVISVGLCQAVFIGVVALSDVILRHQLSEAARENRFDRLARLPGSYYMFVRFPHGIFASGDIAGVKQLGVVASGTRSLITTQVAQQVVPHACGIEMRRDGRRLLRRFWVPDRRRLPVATCAPLLWRRLATGVEARLKQAGLWGPSTGQLSGLLDDLLECGSTTRLRRFGQDWHATGINLLQARSRTWRDRFRLSSLDGELAAVRSLVASQRQETMLDPLDFHWPLLDAHTLSVILATDPATRHSGRLLEALRNEAAR